MFESKLMMTFGNGDYIEETYSDIVFPFGAVPLPQPKYHKPQKPYREIEVAPW
ncbi:MAG: hypothetical protein IJT73_08205 [Selenomonadaceae bacterium]|nr:hypothetical protein [Selenomonadaceae bacterium]